MMTTIRKTGLAAAALMLAQVSFASGLAIQSKYVDAETGQTVKANAQVNLSTALNQKSDYFQTPEMRKTMTVVKLAEGIKIALSDFENSCNDIVRPEAPTPDPLPVPMPHPPLIPFQPVQTRRHVPPISHPPQTEIPETKFTEKCQKEKLNAINTFMSTLTHVEIQLNMIEAHNLSLIGSTGPNAFKNAQERKLREHLDRGQKLVKLMKDVKPGSGFGWCGPGRICAIPAMTRTISSTALESTGFSITSGGAQDARKYRDLVDAGQIPKSSDFQAYGLMNEFQLGLAFDCDSKFCMKPAVAYDAKKNSIYVQVGMGTNLDLDSFERQPANIGLLIDISGSMTAEDNTSKARIEWAKDAVKATLDNLVSGLDYVSITTFTTAAQQIWPIQGETPRPITDADKKMILQKVQALQAGGSTNLNDGLNISYGLLADVRKQLSTQASSYNHRLIAITDANLNQDPDEGGAVQQAEIMSETQNIDLTVIGVGMNFFQDFVERLTTMRGGNYIFAQNGQDMVEYFKGFDTLVTSFAYDFVANLDYDNSLVELVKVHGAPEQAAGLTSNDLVSIKTLFLASSEQGGGARVFEFKLK